MWDVEARKPNWAHLLHSETVNCVASSSDGVRVVVGTENGLIYIGSTEVVDGQTNFQTHHPICEEGIASIAFSPSGDTIAIGSKDNTIYLIRAQDGEDWTEIEKGELKGEQRVKFRLISQGIIFCREGPTRYHILQGERNQQFA